eukprot:CAMPEP_0113492162 /NCGR_PEP_ID=MMETSP0014_2-20120614/27929_1 /TAXON_ID=2857 /ORGANISM="Nitzschia sp." /LENGTH=1134 /DNA_ID=CAMNT_0000385975 /DNA_START=416 /DNA_END=3817 /DNA_ORIENTATION=- /assembly_acc=CAM_ASM_000159
MTDHCSSLQKLRLRSISRKRTRRRLQSHDASSRSSTNSSVVVFASVAVATVLVVLATTTAVVMAGDNNHNNNNINTMSNLQLNDDIPNNDNPNNNDDTSNNNKTLIPSSATTFSTTTRSSVLLEEEEEEEQQQELHGQTERQLQLCDGLCDRYQIGESEIVYGGTTVSLAFPLSDLVPDGTVEILTFSDQDCSVDISDNDYLVPELIYDDNPDPTGEKDRDVEVVYTIDPVKMAGTDVWVERDEGQTIFLSFCMAVNLLNGPVGEEGSQAFSRLDTLVFIRVDFEGSFGDALDVRPGDRLDENALEVYRVDGYWCYQNNTRIADVAPLVQGVPVRVCVEPVERALAAGIRMRRVDSFTYYRIKEDGSEINQETLRDGAPVDDSITELECIRGTELCAFTTVLNTDFFYKPGLVIGYGEAWLQFGTGQVRKRRLVVDMPSLFQNTTTTTALSTGEEDMRTTFALSTHEEQMRRSLQVSGGFANSDAIGVEIFVIPIDENQYEAEAYHCDYQNNPIEIDPLMNGESVRICVRPNEEAREAGVLIESLESWNFTRDLIMQVAVEDNGPAELGGSVTGPCGPTSRVCAFHTILEPDFYPSVGVADGVGMVNLVFGGYVPGRLDISRRRGRRLQVGDEPISAGRSEVGVPTPLDYVQPDVDDACYYDHEFHQWWLEETMTKRITIIGIIGGIIGAIVCSWLCLWCFPPFCWMRQDEDEEVNKNGSNIEVNVDLKKDSKTEMNTSSTAAVASTPPLETAPPEEVRCPRKSDVVFGDNQWPGTLDFFETVIHVADSHPDEEYCPSIYREIKKNASGYDFYSKDVENGKFKKPSKQEIIALIGKMYSEAKTLLRDGGHKPLLSSLGSSTYTGTTYNTSTVSSDAMSRMGSNKSLFSSMSSFGSLNDLGFDETPDEMDVIFGDDNHPGTQKFSRWVLKIARQFRDEDYRPSLYRKIKRPFEENIFLVKNEQEGGSRPIQKKELVTLIGEAFDVAKADVKREIELGSINRTIVVDPQSTEDVSELGSLMAGPVGYDSDRGLKSSRRSSKRSLRDLDRSDKDSRHRRSNSRRRSRSRSKSRSRRSMRNLHDSGKGSRLSRSRSKSRSRRNMRDLDDSGKNSSRPKRSSSSKSLRDLDKDDRDSRR